MFILGVLMTSADFATAGEVGEKIKANGAMAVANIIAGFGTAVIFFGTVFTVTGAMRDDIHKSLEVIHSTPIKSRDMVLSRFTGIFLTTFLCIFALVIGAFAGQFMPWIDKETLGPINVLYYLHPLVFFALPSCLFVSTVYILLAGLTRNQTFVYISAVGLLVVTTMTGLVNEVDKLKTLGALIDPFGGNAVINETEYWPADEQNTRLIPMTGNILINRIIWLAHTVIGIWVAMGLFTRGIVSRPTKGKSVNALDTEVDAIAPFVAVTTAGPNQALFTRFWTRFKYEYATTIKSVPFAILLLLALINFTFGFFLRSQFSTEPVLLTGTQAFFVIQIGFPLFIILMIIFFGGDIIWRDRTAKMTELLDSTPVPNWTLLAAKWTAIIAIIYSVIAFACIIALGGQSILGVGDLEPITMLRRGFLEIGLSMSFMAILVMFVQNFAPNRIFGLILGGILLFGLTIFISFLPFYHPLMGFGSISPGGFSDMNGYRTGSLITMTRFLIYWGGLVGLFAITSVWLWRRGTDVRFATRLKGLRGQIGPITGIAAALFATAFFGMGGHIFYKANIENNFYTDKRAEKRLVEIEKNFKALWKKPLPKIQSVEVDVQLYPNTQEANFKGRYVVENTTGKPLSEVYVRLPFKDGDNIRQLDLKGASHVDTGETVELARELELNMRLYSFEPPLAAGAQTTLNFDVFFAAPKFYAGSPIRKKANFLNNLRMPNFGVPYQFLNDPDKRRKYGLPVKDKRADRDDMDARQYNFFTRAADYVDFQANICTVDGQIPIAPGKFVRETKPENGRVCREYKAINPIMDFFSFVAADYDVDRDIWENPNGPDVDLAIYHHAGHPYNIDRMREAMKSSLGTYSETFGPYQYAQARIMEVAYVNFAQAFAGTIPFSENLGFIMEVEEGDDKVDFMTYVTAHELGHQWFGHQIVPADVKGYNVLSEGLTENASMTAYEVIKGYPMTRRMRKRRGDDYLAGRTSDKNPEPPLALAENQQYIFYNKANMVFWGLRHYMEPGTMNAAIKTFIDQYGSTGAPYPTTLELVDTLRAAAPDNLQQFITDSWDKITFWETSFGDVNVTENDDGTFTVTANAKMAKKYADEETGKETDAETLDEPVEIGFYKEDPSNSWEETPMLLERFRLNEAETELTFTLSERPGYIVIDPRALLVERKYTDNVKALDDSEN